MNAATSPSPSPNTQSNAIAAAADYGYSTVANRHNVDPATVHRLRVCHELSRLMVEHLVKVEGVPAVHDNRGYHGYVALPDTGHIADGTWQQLLPEDRRSADLPKVLFGTRDEVIAQARSYGVPDSDLTHWQPRTAASSTQIVIPTAYSAAVASPPRLASRLWPFPRRPK